MDMDTTSSNGFSESTWIFALIVLLGLFNGGFGGFGNNGTANAVSQADLQRAIDLNSVQTAIAGTDSDIQASAGTINANLQRGIYEINGATKDAAYNNLSEIRDTQAANAAGFANVQTALTAMQANQQNCCCTTQRAIDGVNYNLATQSAAIQANDTANTQKILDAVASNRMADMQNQINALQLQNAIGSMQTQLATTVKYPTTSAWCSGNNPFGTCGCSAM